MNRRILPLIACLAAAACSLGDRSGTYVGNPGAKVVRLAPPDDVVVVEEAITEGASAHWLRCDGGFSTVLSSGRLDLWAPAEIAVPAGSWCAVVLTLDETVAIGGFGENDEFVYDLIVELPAVLTLWAAEPIDVDEDRFVLEVGAPGWLDGELPLEPGDNRFEADGEIAVFFASRLADTVTLYVDADGSGDLDAAERAEGPVASLGFPPPDALDETSEQSRISGETGCSTTPLSHPGPWGLGLLLWLASRRRRSR